MYRGLIVICLLIMGLAAGPSYAQYKPNIPVIKPGVIRILPPSAAVNQALAANPGAKALGIKLRPDNSYIVTLRQGSAVRKIIIPGAQ